MVIIKLNVSHFGEVRCMYAQLEKNDGDIDAENKVQVSLTL